MYPIKFKPIYKERIWGGRELYNCFQKDIPRDLNIGESWELADLPEDKSIANNGFLAGKTLSSILREYPEEITGNKNFQGPFPLLIKFLDAEQDLSLQVHPDSKTCKKTGKGHPKTECWYIIDKKPGSFIYKSIKPGTTKDRLKKAILDGDCAEYLEKVNVNIGDCHLIPAGTAHSIGAGLLIAEIQQPSDTTYRIFDWDRIDTKTGKPRELHIKDAIESIHFDSSCDGLTVLNEGRVADSEEFKVDKIILNANNVADLNYKIMEVIIFIDGYGKFKTHQETCETYDYRKGDTFLIPYTYQGCIVSESKTTCLRVTI